MFLARPKLSEVVQDTKVLLQQSREKLVITYAAPSSCSSSFSCVVTVSSRIASDLSSFDTALYNIGISTQKVSGKCRFHLGEPITINWRAPASHSRKDWVGLYRVGRVNQRIKGCTVIHIAGFRLVRTNLVLSLRHPPLAFGCQCMMKSGMGTYLLG